MPAKETGLKAELEHDEEPGTTSADIAQVDKKLDLSKDTKIKKICEACTEDTKCDECQLAEDLEKLKIKA